MNGHGRLATHAGGSGQIGHGLKRLDESGPAVWVAAVVQRVHTNKNVIGLQHLGQAQGVTQKNGVASGYIGHRNALANLLRTAMLGHRHVAGQRRATNGPHVQAQDAMTGHADGLGNRLGRCQFLTLTLAIVKREGVAVVALRLGQGQTGGRIQPATEQNNSGLHGCTATRCIRRQPGSARCDAAVVRSMAHGLGRP